jgi:hypothetical protein
MGADGAPKLAVRHWCALRDERGAAWAQFHTARNGRPRSERCTYCHGPLVVQSGLWCVFRWSGGRGRYSLDCAVSTHLSESAAGRACEKAHEAARSEFGYGSDEANLVVRWVALDGAA